MQAELPPARVAARPPRASCLHVAADLLSSPEHAHLRPDRAARDAVARVARLCASLGARNQRTLRGEEATCGEVVASMASAVDEVGADGLFVLTFSGHTVLKPGPRWCLYDGALGLERVAEGLGALPAGARAVVVADTCYAATLAR
ncbi:MAG TPA: hypothetical protein VFS00_30875, partial [Polyangiaceae bacterium]|nr:hypothetical protein [Polyangiaceae bacterium]